MTVLGVMLLMSPATYRSRAFHTAAARLGLPTFTAIDMPETLSDRYRGDLAVEFGDTARAVDKVVAFIREHSDHPVAAVIAVDDRGTEIAARASLQLGLPHNDLSSALAARDKWMMRQALERGGVPVPRFEAIPADLDPASIAVEQRYPVVVKPTLMSGSRGVIRADDPEAFITAFLRTRRILEHAGLPADEYPILVEQYVPGVEVALEGLLTEGSLQMLALFDKPDPLEGPFFEETIYTTPSVLEPDLQHAIADRTQASAAAIGLRHGPIHAELRIDRTTGEIWLIELAGRSIGGLCASVLEFGTGVSLEELILRHAAGLDVSATERGTAGAGVMMIPIPKGGMLREVTGQDDALAVPGVTGIEITAPCNRPIVPLPEGDSYLGFIFATGDTAKDAETALRQAHACLRFRIDPAIPLMQTTKLDS